MKAYQVPGTNYTIRYQDLPGNEIPIVFIHGLGCASSYDYPAVASQKPLVGHRRILVDLLGSGYSDKPESFPYTVQSHATYLHKLLGTLTLDSFVLFAHSLGGPVAIELAALCDTRSKALVLSEPNLDKSLPHTTSYRFGTVTEQTFLRTTFTEELRESRKHNPQWGAPLSVCLPVALHRISQNAVQGGTPSWRETLYTLPCKKSCIFGEYSLPDEDEAELQRHGVAVRVVERAGHSMAWENPTGLALQIKESIAVV